MCEHRPSKVCICVEVLNKKKVFINNFAMTDTRIVMRGLCVFQKHLAWEESEDTSTLSDDLVRHTHKHTHHRLV